MEQPTSITPVKVIQRGLTVRDVYGADPEGNVWMCTEGLGKPTWTLFMTAEQVPQPSGLTPEQVSSIGQAK